MLNAIRNRAQGLFAWIIVALIIIPFALWGVNEYVGGAKESPAASVNGVELSQAYVDNAYRMQRQRLQEMLGENFRPEIFSPAVMKRQIVDELIERELLVTAARNAGMRVGDETLGAYIRSIEAFQRDGRFSTDAYQQVVRAQNMTVSQFEAELRRDLLIEQLRLAILSTQFATESEVDNQLRLLNQRRDIGYFTLPAAQFDQVEITDNDIQAYYERNRDRYLLPEQVSIEYLEISLAAIAREIEIPETEIKLHYDQHQADFRTPEQRRASHILIAVPPGADATADAEARAKAAELLQKLQEGASFADLAREYSDDPGSAAQAGDLGYFERGVMVPAFEDAAFNLSRGQLSEPVRSDYGYHIIRIDDVRPGEQKAFSEVSEEIRATLRDRQAADLFYKQAEQLANLTYEHPESLQAAADVLGLRVGKSGYFSRRGGEGVTSQRAVVDAAFSDEVLGRGDNSDVIELGADRMLVIRVSDHKPASRQSLDDVRDSIVAQLTQDKSRAAAQEAAEGALAALQKGEAADVVAKRHGGQWKRIEIGRDAKEPALAVVQAAFAAAKPEGGKPRYTLAPLPDGSSVVVGLYSVKEGAVPAGEERDRQAEVLRRANAKAEYDAFVIGLREQAKISIKSDQL